MVQIFFRFAMSVFIYAFVAICSNMLFVVPSEVANLAIFLAPILGLMWGPAAAVGVCLSGISITPAFRELLYFNVTAQDLIPMFSTAIWLFLATYLPYFLWNNLKVPPQTFSLSTDTLKKFLLILFITFATTSFLRAAFATEQELQAVIGLFGMSKNHTIASYMLTCLCNDFFISMFFDFVLLFLLISKGYKFYNPQGTSNTQEEQLTSEEQKTLMIAASSYLAFPTVAAYLDVFQIYGMNNLKTWLAFILQCVAVMDVYIVLITYMLFRYRRSIMLEIAFLVAIVVFMTAAVLGWGSSLAMSTMVNHYVDESMHAMSVICRERINRTFFLARQAVSGMEHQAVKTAGSYEQIVNDANYRENYLNNMKETFESIAMNTDGCIAYYLRLKPEIAGSRGGFSMARRDNRWEGALSPFIDREPTDLSRYSPEDTDNVGWYYTPIKSQCATWIEPYHDPNYTSYVMSYVAPLKIDGNIIGVIGVDIDFNFIVQELRRMSVYDYGHVYVTNRNNTVLYHKDRLQGSIFKPNPHYREMEMYLANGMWLGIATPLSEVHEVRNTILMHLVNSIMIVAILISLGSIVIVSRAIKPLSGMTEAAKKIASGDLEVKISYDSGNELGLLVRSIREMATKLEAYVYRDKLTGLRNAAAYMVKGNELDTKSQLIPDLAYAVILFDVNFLKKVNDKHGHQAGNQLLRHAARVICRVFKRSPVYRVGGDEFTAVLEHEDYEKRNELLRRFDEELAKESFVIGDETIYVSVARGISIYEQGLEFSAVAKRADSAMYNHKTAIKAKYGEEVR